MRVCCISDTHSKHSQVDIPKCDLLIHAGDFTGSGTEQETIDFLEWFSIQPAQYKIFISGNHDALDEEQPRVFKQLLSAYPNLIYLRDEGITVEGLKIWGRPTTPEFMGWSFMADPGSPKMLSTLSIIPSDIGILVTHGPAYGILDRTSRGELVGCKDLLAELPRFKQLKLMIFGHIHESVGQRTVDGVNHINAAVLNERYIYANRPVIIDI